MLVNKKSEESVKFNPREFEFTEIETKIYLRMFAFKRNIALFTLF